MSPLPLTVQVLPGLTDYGKGHALQLALVEQRKAGEICDTLLLLEHPPVITLGKSADPHGVTASEKDLNRRGINVHRIERGGQATYHGPGQIVGYPIMNLHHLKLGVAQYVHRLEQVMIASAAQMGVPARRREKMTGVFWSMGNGGKIGALGVRVTRGITYHGFALNITPDLSHYQLIVPCGMTDTPVTSLSAITGTKIEMTTAMNHVTDAFLQVFGMTPADAKEAGPQVGDMSTKSS